ncbi:MAG: 50S ribosomal protein L10 [Candidatus Levybacteria bacterium RIFCSPLOWO2_01_FULL_38_13]|nr:MAG: 50S ribosomal protein L10 [Candidatus Levybacteria bacterium RIFCSPHIGHO2_01_FULL_41_15]OGH35701.1 MAG: 50S ribosomal protein L10 [Candidatus Levybacteria bacterium RIFCSPLOWO2_01_FULL_38_13]
MPSQKKIDIVGRLKEKVDRAKSLVFVNYQGLKHKQLEELKKSLKMLDAELVVTKNTLLARALQISSAKSADQISNSTGPTATLFAYGDAIPPLKQLAKSLKMFGLPTIKFGILDNQALTGDQVLKLAMLPSREVLLSQVISVLKSPIYGLHRTLSWNINNLVLTLKVVQNKKQLATSG